MTAKYDKFMEALKELCEEHKITVAHSYDFILVMDWVGAAFLVDAFEFEDNTKEQQ